MGGVALLGPTGPLMASGLLTAYESGVRLDLSSHQRRDFKRHNMCSEDEIMAEELLSVLVFAVIVM